MADTRFLDRIVQRGALINYAGFFAGKLIVFANTVVLARLLAPEHFGLVAIGLLLLSVSEAITEAGTGAALVWRPGSLFTNAAVALSLAMIGAIIMAGSIFLAAPAIAIAFGEPDATSVVQVLALCILFSSPAAVFSAILQKRFQFGRRLIPEITKAVTKGVVGISLALAGFGVWSLVYSQVFAVAIGLALSWWLSGWKPKLSLDPKALHEMLPYAAHIAAIGLLGVAAKKLDVVIIGSQFSAEMLGFYSLAFSLVDLVVLGICWSAGQSLFPALSHSGQDSGQIQTIFERGLSLLLIVTVPIAIGLAVLAKPFVLAVYGVKWMASAELMQILAFYALIYSTGFNLGDVYKATGRPNVLTWINLANLLCAIPILLLGSLWGMQGVAWGQVFVALVISGINWSLANRLTGIKPTVLFVALKAPLIAAACAAFACLLADHFLFAASPPLLALSVEAFIGLATYAAVLLLLKPKILRKPQKEKLDQPAPLASDTFQGPQP